jgi:thioredoxin-related protein
MTRSRSVLRPAALALVLGAAVATGGAAGVAWALDAAPGPTPQVIRGPASPAQPGARGVPGDGKLAWNELEPALAEAKRANKPLLVDVYTDWCGWCRRMDKTTYGNAEVRDYVARSFVPARVNAEDDARRATYEGEERTYRQFADRFRITGYPTTLFLAPDGTLITQLPGYVKPQTFLTVLRYVAEGHYRTRSWDAYSRVPDDARP